MNLWWLDVTTSKWSDEELSVRTRIALFAMVPTVGIIFLTIAVLRLLGIDDHVGAILSMCPALLIGLYLGRKLAEQLWPDLVRKADANAAKRLGK
jgi:hypothetical protein